MAKGVMKKKTFLLGLVIMVVSILFPVSPAALAADSPAPGTIPTNAGNSSSGESQNQWVPMTDGVDTTSPVIVEISVPVNGAVYGPYTMFEYMTGSIADYPGIASGLPADSAVYTLARASDGYYWNGIDWQADEIWLATRHDATGDDGSEVEWRNNVVPPGWNDDVYTVILKAIDYSYNSQLSLPVSFTYDSVPPVVDVTWPEAGKIFAGGSTVIVTWNATDTYGIMDTVNIQYFDGVYWHWANWGIPNTGSYEWTMPWINTDNAMVMVGVTDNAGNEGWASSEPFAVDASSPEVTIYDIPDTVNYLPNVFGNAVDYGLGGMGSVKLSLHDETSGFYLDDSGQSETEIWRNVFMDNNKYEWVCPLPPLENGHNYRVSAHSIDTIGNQSETASDYFLYQQEQAPSGIPGDVNGDGNVNVFDITIIVKMILRLPPYDN
ncbi:MAG: hypothetical protein JW712_12520 [Dehalococcoidales bacterium]|nr:hypothetical protein [Dehalococcoidales bacterium]